jgi:hypothetical protein
MFGMRMSSSATWGRSRGHEFDRLRAFAGLGDDVDVGFGVQQLDQAGAHQLLIVAHDYPDAHAEAAGSRAWTRKLSSARDPASSEPP